MSNFWQPTSSTRPHNWSNSTSKEWDTMPHKAECKPKICMPGHPICTKLHTTKLVYTRPTKRLKIAEGSFFDILPINILTLIDDWIIRSEYKDEHNTIVLCFTCQKFSALCIFLHKQQKPHHNYGILQFYGTSRYKWSHSIDKTFPLGLYTNRYWQTTNANDYTHSNHITLILFILASLILYYHGLTHGERDVL